MGIQITIITGSSSRTSRLFAIVDYTAQQLNNRGAQIEYVHVPDIPAEDLILGRFDSPDVKKAVEKVEQADAVIISSPVYKASYTGVLKTFLDLLPQKALEKKIILPLFIGGTIAHFLSIEYALKPVLSVLGARYILTGAYAVDSQVKLNEQGSAELDQELRIRLDNVISEYWESIGLHLPAVRLP